MTFDVEPSAGDKTLIDAVVASHVGLMLFDIDMDNILATQVFS